MAGAARVVMITGAARRIGAAIARAMHVAGYDLALHARHSHSELAALAAELDGARAGSVLTLSADFADASQLAPLVDASIARFGRLDGLVNNASAFYATPLGEISPAQWDDLFAANARAPLFLAQAAAPHLAARRGAIVNIADIYAERALAGSSVYTMAKAALIAATRALALELAPDVRVNAVAPGAVLWPDAGKQPQERERLLARTPLARTATPEEIADAVRWLLADASYVTGQVIRVDGGRSITT